MKKKYILILSNKSDITTDLVIKRLYEREISFIRFNTEDFPQNIFGEIKLDTTDYNSSIITSKGELNESEIKSVWYRRPKLPQYQNISMDKEEFEFATRESNSFLLNLWSVFSNKLWVNNPFDLYLAERKAVQLKCASECMMRIPKTLITNKTDSVKEFIHHFNGKVIAKPISHGGFGYNDEYAIFTTDLENNNYQLLNKSINYSPFILQEKVNKGFDVRVSVFGEKVFGHKILPKNNIIGIDWRVLKPNEITYELIKLPHHINTNILKFMSLFNLKYSAMDFVVDKNENWYFIENNPNGQFAWLEIANGDKLIDSLINLLWN